MNWNELRDEIDAMTEARRRKAVVWVGDDGPDDRKVVRLLLTQAEFEVCVGWGVSAEPVIPAGDYHLYDEPPGEDDGEMTWGELAAAIGKMPARLRKKDVQCVRGYDTPNQRAGGAYTCRASGTVRDGEGKVVLRKGDTHLY